MTSQNFNIPIHKPVQEAFNGVKVGKNGRLIPTAYSQVKTFENGKEPIKAFYIGLDGNDDNEGTYDKPFLSFEKALSVTEPGTSILIKPGVYNDIFLFAHNLNGTEKKPIWIGGIPGEEYPVFTLPSPLTIAGGSYLVLHDMEVTRLTEPLKGDSVDSYAHGIHVNDGGTLDSSHYFVFRNLYVHNIWNSPFKLSGIDYGYLFDCEIADDPLYGRNSGSADHVRSNNMTMAYNYMHGTTTNGFSFKGGSYDSIIHHNLIVDCHVGAHMGQSTGVQFFRPPLLPMGETQVTYEARNILTYSNIMIDVLTPFTISSARDCYAVNNTIIVRKPRIPNQSRLFRILNQGAWFHKKNEDGREIESKPIMPATANNGYPHFDTIANNIFYYGGEMATDILNGGKDIPLDTFTVKNNLFYNYSNKNCLPDEYTDSDFAYIFDDFKHEDLIIGQDPLFEDADNNDFKLRANSPALDSGADYDFAKEDFFGKPFAKKRSIGAVQF